MCATRLYTKRVFNFIYHIDSLVIYGGFTSAFIVKTNKCIKCQLANKHSLYIYINKQIWKFNVFGSNTHARTINIFNNMPIDGAIVEAFARALAMKEIQFEFIIPRHKRNWINVYYCILCRPKACAGLDALVDRFVVGANIVIFVLYTNVELYIYNTGRDEHTIVLRREVQLYIYTQTYTADIMWFMFRKYLMHINSCAYTPHSD